MIDDSDRLTKCTQILILYKWNNFLWCINQYVCSWSYIGGFICFSKQCMNSEKNNILLLYTDL